MLFRSIERLNPPFLDMRSANWVAPECYETRGDAKRFENWESYVAGRIGPGVALEYMTAIGMDNIWARIQELASALRTELAELRQVNVHDQGKDRCGIVTFSCEGIGASELSASLREKHRINTSVSEVQLTRGKLLEVGTHEILRASVHTYNTEEEIARFIAAAKKQLG